MPPPTTRHLGRCPRLWLGCTFGAKRTDFIFNAHGMSADRIAHFAPKVQGSSSLGQRPRKDSTFYSALKGALIDTAAGVEKLGMVRRVPSQNFHSIRQSVARDVQYKLLKACRGSLAVDSRSVCENVTTGLVLILRVDVKRSILAIVGYWEKSVRQRAPDRFPESLCFLHHVAPERWPRTFCNEDPRDFESKPHRCAVFCQESPILGRKSQRQSGLCLANHFFRRGSSYG